MALFGKKAGQDRGSVEPQSADVQVGEKDLAAAKVALDAFSLAANRDAGGGAAGLKLARAAGFRGAADQLQRVARKSGDKVHVNREIYREWYWLVAVARLAAQRGDLHTVALALLFTDLWDTQVKPGLGELDEVGLLRPPERVVADLAVLALERFAGQGHRQVIASGPAATITVAEVVTLASFRLVRLAKSSLPIDPGLVGLAHRTLAAYQPSTGSRTGRQSDEAASTGPTAPAASAALPGPAPPAGEPLHSGGDSVDTLARLGWEREQAGDLAGAEAAYRQGDVRGEARSSDALGRLLASRGDIDGAEQAFRRADALGDADGAYNLGILLEFERGDRVGAEEAWRRADERGNPAAAFNLGSALREKGDVAGALQCWNRAMENGDATAAHNLGVLQEHRGDLGAAESAWRRGDQLGSASATAALARLLEQRGDLVEAVAAYRRADQGGDPDGAFGLGKLLYDSGDHDGAVAAFRRAAERGHAGAPQIVAMLSEPTG